MPDQTQLVDELRRRIADPGACLPRRFDAGQPVETMAAWRARAVAAGLQDGTLGYIPAEQLADVQEDLARTIDEADQLRRELDTTRTEADRAIADLRQVDGLISDVVVTLEDWLHDTTADGIPIGQLFNRIRHGLREGTAPVPGSSRRVQDAHAQGYAEAVARLRDDERYRNWWTSGGVKPDGPLRGHLADYLETVGPAGVNVETGRWPAREHAVIRAAIAWRAHSGDQPQVWADADDLALIEAVDALPHAGESQASEPADRLAATEPTQDADAVRTAGQALLDVLHSFALPFEANRAAYRLHQALAGDQPAGPKLAQGGIVRTNKLAIVGEQTDGCVVSSSIPGQELYQALVDAGILHTGQGIRRIVIDSRAGHPVVIHIERKADERLLDVVPALDGAEVRDLTETAAAELERPIDLDDCAPKPARSTPDLHIGRAWSGHVIEDHCPCPQEPCGLVSTPSLDCDQHKSSRSIRQGHPADDCPGGHRG